MSDTNLTTSGSNKTRSNGVMPAILLDMADTTWRIFIPTVGLLLVGRYYDVRLNAKPWLMLLGAITGALIAAVLIRNQIKRGSRR